MCTSGKSCFEKMAKNLLWDISSIYEAMIPWLSSLSLVKLAGRRSTLTWHKFFALFCYLEPAGELFLCSCSEWAWLIIIITSDIVFVYIQPHVVVMAGTRRSSRHSHARGFVFKSYTAPGGFSWDPRGLLPRISSSGDLYFIHVHVSSILKTFQGEIVVILVMAAPALLQEMASIGWVHRIPLYQIFWWPECLNNIGFSFMHVPHVHIQDMPPNINMSKIREWLLITRRGWSGNVGGGML